MSRRLPLRPFMIASMGATLFMPMWVTYVYIPPLYGFHGIGGAKTCSCWVGLPQHDTFLPCYQ